MKDINGKELQQPYYDLAVMRREKKRGVRDTTIMLLSAFNWFITPEGYDWWFSVYKGNHPHISYISLTELEEWRESKQPADTTDWKAKYEELLQKHTDLFKIHQKAMSEYDRVTAEPSNFIAECAMRAMQWRLSIEWGVSTKLILETLALPEDTE